MSSPMKLGYWWRRDGGVAAVSHVSSQTRAWPWVGLILNSEGDFLSVCHWDGKGARGDVVGHGWDLVEYIGQNPPAKYRRESQKKAPCPWNKADLMSHLNSWFISPGEAGTMHRAAGYEFPCIYLPTLGKWISVTELFDADWTFVSLPGDEPRRCCSWI